MERLFSLESPRFWLQNLGFSAPSLLLHPPSLDNRHLATLRVIEPEPFVESHPETAKTLGIEDGDQVYIKTRAGTSV